jgi:hypothetical protein
MIATASANSRALAGEASAVLMTGLTFGLIRSSVLGPRIRRRTA